MPALLPPMRCVCSRKAFAMQTSVMKTLFSSSGTLTPQSNDIRRCAQHLIELLQIKTDAEYGERLMNRRDAEIHIKHAERLFDYVASRIKG